MLKVNLDGGPELTDYESYASLSGTVREYLKSSKNLLPNVKGPTIWMVNSTETGGGVAEMLPSQIRILREQGLKVEWLVMEAANEHFFEVTKKVHNGIHGAGDRIDFSKEDAAIYEQVNQNNAEKAKAFFQEGDMVIVHDPQPAGMIQYVKQEMDIQAIWRCHIGLEERNEATKSSWQFLEPYLDAFDHFVFSLPEYVPDFIRDNVTIIPPSIDPLSHKNRTLQLHKCIGILHQSGVIDDKEPVLYDFFPHPVQRVQPDGSFGAVNASEELDIIFRPTILQVSRWDRLKGFREVLEAFINLKQKIDIHRDNPIHFKRIKKVRLILAGPDPDYVKDDPEGQKVLEDLISIYQKADRKYQQDIAILLLPMKEAKQNALIVNALQRSSSIIVQNSLREGFGLTATEAMWKQIPIVVSSAAGLVSQVEHEKNGLIIQDATNTEELTYALDRMLVNPKLREKWGFNGQLRVIEHFTIFSQLKGWLQLLAALPRV